MIGTIQIQELFRIILNKKRFLVANKKNPEIIQFQD